MATRVTRATSAMPPKPIVSTGSTSAVQVLAPDTGNQPSCTENSRIISSASQKLGTVEPSRMKALRPFSAAGLFATAAAVPATSPTIDEKAKASAPSLRL